MKTKLTLWLCVCSVVIPLLSSFIVVKITEPARAYYDSVVVDGVVQVGQVANDASQLLLPPQSPPGNSFFGTGCSISAEGVQYIVLQGPGAMSPALRIMDTGELYTFNSDDWFIVVAVADDAYASTCSIRPNSALVEQVKLDRSTGKVSWQVNSNWYTQEYPPQGYVVIVRAL